MMKGFAVAQSEASMWITYLLQMRLQVSLVGVRLTVCMCECAISNSALLFPSHQLLPCAWSPQTWSKCLIYVWTECGPMTVLLNEVCIGGKKPASLQTWRSGSPVCPSPSFPTALLLKQNHFQAALLCSKHCGGRELSRKSNLHSCSLFILERLHCHWYGFNVKSYWNQAKKHNVSSSTTKPINCLKATRMAVEKVWVCFFFLPWKPAAAIESYLKWRSTESEGKHLGFFQCKPAVSAAEYHLSPGY